MCIQCGADDGMDACRECWEAHFGKDEEEQDEAEAYLQECYEKGIDPNEVL